MKISHNFIDECGDGDIYGSVKKVYKDTGRSVVFFENNNINNRYSYFNNIISISYDKKILSFDEAENVYILFTDDKILYNTRKRLGIANTDKIYKVTYNLLDTKDKEDASFCGTWNETINALYNLGVTAKSFKEIENNVIFFKDDKFEGTIVQYSSNYDIISLFLARSKDIDKKSLIDNYAYDLANGIYYQNKECYLQQH